MKAPRLTSDGTSVAYLLRVSAELRAAIGLAERAHDRMYPRSDDYPGPNELGEARAEWVLFSERVKDLVREAATYQMELSEAVDKRKAKP